MGETQAKSILAVDPGIRGSGVALFRDGRLIAAAYVKSPAKAGNRAAEAAAMAYAIATWAMIERFADRMLVVEWPQVYASRIRAGTTKGDPNDLLALCGVGAAISACLNVPTVTYLPHEWKGSIDGDVMCARIMTRLDGVERAIVDAVLPESKRHNAIDACGLGLHHLGRLQAKRIVTTGSERTEVR